MLKFNYTVFIPQERMKVREKINIRRMRSKTCGKRVRKELLPQFNTKDIECLVLQNMKQSNIDKI